MLQQTVRCVFIMQLNEQTEIKDIMLPLLFTNLNKTDHGCSFTLVLCNYKSNE